MVRRERERKVRVRKRRKVPPLTAEEMDWLATLAADAGRLDLAVRLVRMAIRRAPDDAHLYDDLGFYRARLGDVAGAVAAYGRAARRSTDGRAELEAACLLARDEASWGEAERLLARALEKDPALAVEVGEADLPEAFAARPGVASAFRRALRL